MVQKSHSQPPFGCFWNPVKNEIATTNPQLVSLPDFWTINSNEGFLEAFATAQNLAKQSGDLAWSFKL